MRNEYMAILILAVVLVGFQSKRIPMGVTAVLGALAMAFTGIISVGDAMKSFGGETFMTVLGLQAMGVALSATGVSGLIGRTILRFPRIMESERIFLTVSLTVIAVLSAFFSNTVLVLLFIPVVDAVSRSTGGKIRRKSCIMALAIGSMVGGVFTMIGTQPQLIAQGLLESGGYRSMGFFTPGLASFPVFFWMILYYNTIGYKLQNKYFDFSGEYSGPNITTGITEPARKFSNGLTGKSYFSIAILVFYVFCAAFGIFTLGSVALLCCCLCVLFGCTSFEQLIKGIDWNTMFVIGGSLGFAEGMNQSGALTMIANTLVSVMGGSRANPYLLLVLFVLLAGLVGNFMSNNATVAVICPLAIAVASRLGVDPLVFATAVAVSPAYANATPVANPVMTLTLSAGYRFKDYVITVGPFCIGALVISAFWLPIVFSF